MSWNIEVRSHDKSTIRTAVNKEDGAPSEVREMITRFCDGVVVPPSFTLVVKASGQSDRRLENRMISGTFDIRLAKT